jgi:type IV secretory pathway VirB6-like protein
MHAYGGGSPYGSDSLYEGCIMGGDFGTSSNVYVNITPNGSICSSDCRQVCSVFGRKPSVNNFLSDGSEVYDNCISACLKGFGFRGRAYGSAGKYSTEVTDIQPVASCQQQAPIATKTGVTVNKGDVIKLAYDQITIVDNKVALVRGVLPNASKEQLGADPTVNANKILAEDLENLSNSFAYRRKSITSPEGDYEAIVQESCLSTICGIVGEAKCSAGLSYQDVIGIGAGITVKNIDGTDIDFRNDVCQWYGRNTEGTRTGIIINDKDNVYFSWAEGFSVGDGARDDRANYYSSFNKDIPDWATKQQENKAKVLANSGILINNQLINGEGWREGENQFICLTSSISDVDGVGYRLGSMQLNEKLVGEQSATQAEQVGLVDYIKASQSQQSQLYDKCCTSNYSPPDPECVNVCCNTLCNPDPNDPNALLKVDGKCLLPDKYVEAKKVPTYQFNSFADNQIADGNGGSIQLPNDEIILKHPAVANTEVISGAHDVKIFVEKHIESYPELNWRLEYCVVASNEGLEDCNWIAAPDIPVDERSCRGIQMVKSGQLYLRSNMRELSPGTIKSYALPEHELEIILRQGSVGESSLGFFSRTLQMIKKTFVKGYNDDNDGNNSGIVIKLYKLVLQETGLQTMIQVFAALGITFVSLGFLVGIVEFNYQMLIVYIVKLAIVLSLFSDIMIDFVTQDALTMFIDGAEFLIWSVVEAYNNVGIFKPELYEKIQADSTNIFLIFDLLIQELTEPIIWKKIYALGTNAGWGPSLLTTLIWIFGLFYYVVTIFEIFVMYITFIIGISILIIIAPIIIPLMLFKLTKQIFDSWWKYLLSYMLQPTLVFAIVLLLNAYMLAILHSGLGFSICPKCIFEINILNLFKFCAIPGYGLTAWMHYPEDFGYNPSPVFMATTLALIFFLLALTMRSIPSFIVDVTARIVTGSPIRLATIAGSWRNINTFMQHKAPEYLYNAGAAVWGVASSAGSGAKKIGENIQTRRDISKLRKELPNLQSEERKARDELRDARRARRDNDPE